MRFVPNWKMTILAVLAFAGTVQSRGCTDREIAAGVGGAVIGAIITTPQPVYVQPRSRYCNTVVEANCWDAFGYDGRYMGRQCAPPSRYTSCNSYKMELSSDAISKSKIEDFAQANKLTIAAAEQLVNSLTAAKNAQDDDSANAALQSICLTVEELKSIGKSGALSDATVDCIAKTLNQDPKQTAMMVGSITETMRAQEAARAQSHYNN